MRAAFVLLAGLLLAGACSPLACSFGIDVPALSECRDRDRDCGAADEGPSSGEAGEGGAPDDGSSPEAADSAPTTCPTGRGPAMVRIAAAPAFCIDASEVTADQYAAFLASPERPAPARPAATCKARTDFTPKGAWPAAPGRGTTPVVYVDFCDAQAFCAWSGKALCGARGGGALDVAMMNRAPGDGWFVGCGGAEGSYPYGNVYDADKCNGVDHGVTAPVPVESLGACRTPSGAFDLSGNVWEWTDTCESDVDVATDRCFARGGAFNAPAAELKCASRRASTRGETDPTIGFRCCAP